MIKWMHNLRYVSEGERLRFKWRSFSESQFCTATWRNKCRWYRRWERGDRHDYKDSKTKNEMEKENSRYWLIFFKVSVGRLLSFMIHIFNYHLQAVSFSSVQVKSCWDECLEEPGKQASADAWHIPWHKPTFFVRHIHTFCTSTHTRLSCGLY